MSRGLTIVDAHNLFREYVDDPDATFITTAQVQRYLEFGLEQWREIIRNHNPHIYGTLCEFSTGTAFDSSYNAQVDAVKPRRNSLDLGSALLRSSMSDGNQAAVMGAAAIQDWLQQFDTPAVANVIQVPPIDTILDVYSYNPSTKDRTGRMRKLAGAQAQELSILSWTYFLDGTVLSANGVPPNNMLLEYIPIAKYPMDYSLTVGPAPWPEGSPYIEDNLLPQFHELVVLLATKRYMIRDQNMNEILLKEMAVQIQGMSEYLTRTQLMGAKDSVTVTMHF